MPRPVGSVNKTVHHLVCERCGESYTAMHPSRLHCPRPCAVDGCPRLNASGGYCKTHRPMVLGTEVVKFGPYSAKVARVITAYRAGRGERCDLCQEPFEEIQRGALSPTVDHDHEHCERSYGCLACIRGVVHARCNASKALRRRRTRRSRHARAYLRRPPFQSWLKTADLPPLVGRL